MGWWSADIMGGDTPLDFKSAIYDKLKLDQFKCSKKQVKKAFEGLTETQLQKMIPSIVTKWGCGEPGKDYHTDQTSIGYQVLAVEMMASGVRIQPSIFKLFEKWIPQDQWALEDDERNGKIDDLLKKLYKYDSTPVEIESKGLLEVYYDKILKDKA